jgi:DNA (cytosine-5)-methyltransferase 1
MGKGVYYNEFSKQKAAWLRHLIEEGAIAHGVVDERSITEVQPEDLEGFAQCHFFAGIGLWSLCLRRAGWPDDRPVWTGSCPCGPFSKAGLRQGFEDPRHLWPFWFPLIRKCRPDIVFGEQSDEADAWIDLVQSDMEGDGYALGTAIIPAAGFDGAHARHRIGFVADANNTEWWTERAPWNDGHWPKAGRIEGYRDARDGGQGLGLADADASGQQEQQEFNGAGATGGLEMGSGRGALRCGYPSGLGDPEEARWDARGEFGTYRRSAQLSDGSGVVDWLACRDSRWRPIEPGLSPLVDADPTRMGRLRGYGDAIDVETFTQLIAAYLEVSPLQSQRAAA